MEKPLYNVGDKVIWEDGTDESVLYREIIRVDEAVYYYKTMPNDAPHQMTFSKFERSSRLMNPLEQALL